MGSEEEQLLPLLVPEGSFACLDLFLSLSSPWIFQQLLELEPALIAFWAARRTISLQEMPEPGVWQLIICVITAPAADPAPPESAEESEPPPWQAMLFIYSSPK